MIVGYGRTSTADQVAGLEAQVRELEAAGCQRIFREQASSVATRDQLDAVLEFVRDGDTLVVSRLDRLARSSQHLWELVRRLDEKGVSLRILNLGGDVVDTRGAAGRLIPDELREAAAIDGASYWRTQWHITLPLLGPTIRIFSINPAEIILTNRGFQSK